MVSPVVVRKANHDKVKKIVSKSTRSDVRIRNDNGLARIKDMQHFRDHNIEKHIGSHISAFSRPEKGFQPTRSIARGSNNEMHAYQQDVHVSVAASRFHPELVVYNAGTNILDGDPLGRLKDIQENRDCYDSLFSVRAATTNNAHGYSKSIRPWNLPLDSSVQTPLVSGVDIIGSSTSSRPSNELEETNTQPSSVTDVDIIGTTKTKRKRGKTKGHRLSKIRDEGQRFEIMFLDHVNRAVGPYSTMFTTEIRILVRQIAPLQAKSWSGVSREKKNNILARLHDKFTFSNHPNVIDSIEKTMAKRYSSWRSRIHEEFSKHQTVAAAISKPPPLCIKVQNWVYLCNLFSTEPFKAISERNRKNRDKLATTHAAGTKAYSKIKYDKRNQTTQSELDIVDLYEDTHINSDGVWVHENAKMFHESLKEHKSKAEIEGINLTDEQLSVLTFGRKSGYISGLGRGPKPTLSATGKRTRTELEREANEAIKRAEAAEKEVVEARKETTRLAERMKVLESQQTDFSTKLREEMSSKFAFIHQQLFREKTLNGMENEGLNVGPGVASRYV